MQHSIMIGDSVGIIIPARFDSSRFPGKPLALINGTPMLLHVYRRVRQVARENQVFVATDSTRISEFCNQNNIRSIQTSEKCLTGTDRVAEAISNLNFEIFVNVQGDEPIINPKDIVRAAEEKFRDMRFVINGYSPYFTNNDLCDKSIPKIVMREDNTLIYASRSNIPVQHVPNPNISHSLNQQICVYVYDRNQLEAFHSFGRKSTTELQEDIEILRFLELSVPVKMIKMEKTIAVDYPSDITRVEEFLSLMI